MSLMPLDELSNEAYANHPSDPVDLKRQAITLLLRPGDCCSLRLGEWPLLMKNWLVSFLERCIPTGEVEALLVSMLITFVCVCSVALNVEKRKPNTNNQRDVFFFALIQLV